MQILKNLQKLFKNGDSSPHHRKINEQPTLFGDNP